MADLDLLEKLKQFKAVQLQKKAANWEEAIQICGKPLVEAKAIKQEYLDSIIKATKDLGPYYIICDGVAMPHSSGREFIVEDAFSLLTLKSPLLFPGDSREVDTLMLLAVANTDAHTSIALPQIVALFEDSQKREQIARASSVSEVLDLISSVDYKRYLG